MFLKTLKIADHPLLTNTDVSFSIPDQQHVGSGMNYVVGKSGSGKTKLLHTLLPTQFPRNFNSDERVLPIDSKLYKSEALNKSGQPFTVTQQVKIIPPGGILHYKTDYLFEAKAYEETVGSGSTQSVLKAENRFGKLYPKNSMNSGHGEKRFNGLMDQLDILAKDGKTTSIIIEEPEAYLDPENQLILLKRLGEISKTIQVIISTHSPYMVSWDFLSNGATVLKLNRIGSEAKVGIFCNPRIAQLLNHPGKRNPHLRGIESKNIFFSNKVLVLEGQEDVGVISEYLDEENIDYDFVYFGYGAGANSKISPVLQLCSDLKISRVAALFDYDKDSRSKLFLQSQKDYGHYKVLELKADDIRDKPDSSTVPLVKVGAFNYDSKKEKYSLKVGAFGEDFVNNIHEILDYFK